MFLSWVLIAYIGLGNPIARETKVQSGFDAKAECEVVLRTKVAASAAPGRGGVLSYACVPEVPLMATVEAARKMLILNAPKAAPEQPRRAPDQPRRTVLAPAYFEWVLVLVQSESGNGPTARDILAEQSFKWKPECERALKEVTALRTKWLSTKPAGSWPYNTSYHCHRRLMMADRI